MVRNACMGGKEKGMNRCNSSWSFNKESGAALVDMKPKMKNPEDSLSKAFYEELLHIIGLTEYIKDGRSFLIRKNAQERHPDALLEMIIQQLDSKVVFYRVENQSRFGATYEEQLYSVALHLLLSWIGRILFLKLLEGQLLKLHGGHKDYQFLRPDKITSFHELDKLFFEVLAKKPANRSNGAAVNFTKVPYLNSILFEPTEIEQQAFFISNLRDNAALPLLPNSVLKGAKGKKRVGSLSTLQYLLSFLNAFDFSLEERIKRQEEGKTLVNAKAVRLLLDKLIQHKEGHLTIPNHLDLQVCQQSINAVILNKFNSTKGWTCHTLDELREKITNLSEANQIVNTLRICDPAVGGGRFLVFALNEILAVKSQLGILIDLNGKPLKGYTLQVLEEELIISNAEGDIFEYQLENIESHRVQKTLFHEKQTIISNCLYGVDCRSLAVNSCLSLWMELAKSAYYHWPIPAAELSSPVCYASSSEVNKDFMEPDEVGMPELQPLPNIDLNIKCGNAFVSRFPLEADLRQAFKSSRLSVHDYQMAVQSYCCAARKEERVEARRLMDEIRTDIRTELLKFDPRLIRLQQLNGELYVLLNHIDNAAVSEEEMKARKDYIALLYLEIDKLSVALNEIESNPCYESGFEWRVEFPQLLSQDGSFHGFDLVFTQAPLYRETSAALNSALQATYATYEEKVPLHAYFLELGIKLLKPGGELTLFLPDSWIKEEKESKLVSWMHQYSISRMETYEPFSGWHAEGEKASFCCIIKLKASSEAKNQVG